MKKFIPFALIALCCSFSPLSSHCQMPCGIYHDGMVFDQIDQFVETMIKGVTVLQDSEFKTVQDRNEFTRWVMNKERMCNECGELLLTYFLQQKIKPNEPDTAQKLESCHKLIFTLVQIKQTVDLKAVSAFDSEWEKFKLFFHVAGYQCAVEKKTLKEWEEKRRKAEAEGLIPKTDEKTHDEMHQEGIDHTH